MVGLFPQQVTFTGAQSNTVTVTLPTTGTASSPSLNVVFVSRADRFITYPDGARGVEFNPPIPAEDVADNAFLQYVNHWYTIGNGVTSSGVDLPKISPEVLARARRLLEGILPHDELVRWDHDHYVEVKSRLHPGRTYRIGTFSLFFYGEPLIDVYVNGVKYAKVCLHVEGLGPVLEDNLTAKYLLCAYAEEEVDEVGNWTYLDGSEFTRDRAQDFVVA